METIAATPVWAEFAYLIAGVLFILALRGLSSPESSQKGNQYGMIGMAIAVLATVLGPLVTKAGLPWILGAMTLGGTTGRARFLNSGTGAIDAGQLVARDLIVMSQGMGSGAFNARYTADISAMGLGSISVSGTPKCTVRGPGPVACANR